MCINLKIPYLTSYFLGLSFLGLSVFAFAQSYPHSIYTYGGLTRLDTTQTVIYLTFTGGDYNDGRKMVQRVLRKKKVKANFFFTGDFYRLKENRSFIRALVQSGHYLGPHSDKHLLYAPWENRDSLLVSKAQFIQDLGNNYKAMAAFDIQQIAAPFFMPPYEWYNQEISNWTAELGLQLINFTAGTRSNADYTTPDMGKRYLSSQLIFDSILDYESKDRHGLNGFILLLHVGTHPNRTDKLYRRLPSLIDTLRAKGYRFASLHEL